MTTKAPPFRAQAQHGSEQIGIDEGLLRALVVNDSPRMLKRLNSLLEEHGDFLSVGSATDGHQAMRRVVELEPDLVLMSLRLTVMNGLEVTRLIKSRARPPTVIMVVPDDISENRAAAFAAGSDDFIGVREILTRLPATIRRLFSLEAR